MFAGDISTQIKFSSCSVLSLILLVIMGWG